MKADKCKHFLAGLAVIFIALPCYQWGGITSGLWSCWAGIAAGCIKEWADYQHVKRWDWRDLAATCVGVAVIALLILGLHYGKG